MKNIFYLIIFIVCITNSCKKDPLDKYYWGEASATKNGNTSWKVKTKYVDNKPNGQGIDIFFDLYNDQKHLRENLFFYKINNSIGVNNIKIQASSSTEANPGVFYSTLLDDGDVAGDSFSLLEGKIENKLTIDKKKGDEIWGTFQVALLKNKNFTASDPTAPDTIIFTNGKFHTKLIQ